MSTGRPVLDGILAAAAVVGALGVIVRALKLADLWRGLRLFLLDWLGEPARPGAPERPSFPARMAHVEARTDTTAAQVAAVAGEVSQRLQLLQEGTTALYAQAERNGADVARLEDRVSEHRRRNEDQIALLREAINRIEAEQLALRLARDLRAVDDTSREE